MTNTTLTPPSVAARLGVDPVTVRRWIAAGKLPAFKPGPHATARVREEDLHRFLKENTK